MAESVSKISKILFLDFDGPMIPMRAWSLTDTMLSDRFDPIAAATIKILLEKNQEIGLVISSSWRDLGHNRIKEMLDREGVPSEYLHPDWETKNLENHLMANRHTEILEWLGRHPEIKNYVAVDDYPLKLPDEHFVHVTSNDGLVWSAQRKLFRLFGAKGFGY